MAKILIVDDESSIRRSIGRFLKMRGHEVTEACDGMDALDVLATDQFDVAIVDLVMPRMNGADLIDRMGVEFVETRILVVSAYPDVFDMDKSAADIVRVLRKPFELRDLADALDAALSPA